MSEKEPRNDNNNNNNMLFLLSCLKLPLFNQLKESNRFTLARYCLPKKLGFSLINYIVYFSAILLFSFISWVLITLAPDAMTCTGDCKLSFECKLISQSSTLYRPHLKFVELKSSHPPFFAVFVAENFQISALILVPNMLILPYFGTTAFRFFVLSVLR